MPQLIDSLRYLRGNFGERLSMGSFDGNRTIPNAISAQADSAVRPLLECMGRGDSTGVTWQGTPMSLGAVCYAMLENLIYYESYDDPVWIRHNGGDKYAPWPGDITKPPVSAAALRAAQSAWRDVVRRHMHRFS